MEPSQVNHFVSVNFPVFKSFSRGFKFASLISRFFYNLNCEKREIKEP